MRNNTDDYFTSLSDKQVEEILAVLNEWNNNVSNIDAREKLKKLSRTRHIQW